MEIYNNKGNWKWLLATGGFIIVLMTMLYSYYLADNLARKEESTVKLFTEAQKSILDNEAGDDTSLELYIVTNLGDIPIIMENEEGELTGYNYDGTGSVTTDQEVLTKTKARLLKGGYDPIEGFSGYSDKIYYENSRLYHRISYFPLVQIGLLGTFFLFAYYLFSSSRKAEQNRVWAGMAKETAHQLGTPISAILGWIEHLKDATLSREDQQEVVVELRNDVTRLELIADRFSKIGSKPKLDKVNLVEQLHACMVYMKRRAPSKVAFAFPALDSAPVHARINSHLFDWVIENLLRNALDAMDGQGTITAALAIRDNKVLIDITDTGKGIDSSKFKSVFNPGYTTKKRGWGLGLSLAKRIIDNYHSGKIFVKNSIPNEETTFSIHLPLA